MFTHAALGKTYYVAPNGNDSGSGAIDQPLALLNTGASLLSAGDTLYLRAGTYYQCLWVGHSGNPGSPITISGYPGETAVITGGNTNPVNVTDELVALAGSNVIVKDITIQNSHGIGLCLCGPEDSAIRIRSQFNMSSGIYFYYSDHSMATNCEVYYNSVMNDHFTNTVWAGGLNCRGGISNTIVNNTVWNNWGEGMSTYNSSNTTMMANVVYDNKVNVYLSDCRYALLAGNLIYSTTGNIWSNSNNQAGIMLGDENYTPPSSDNTIINNLVMGCYNNVNYWRGLRGGGLVNVLIVNNTFVNAIGNANLKIGDGTHTNSVIQNNVFMQQDSVPIALVMSQTNGIRFSYNLWSKPPPAFLQGVSDVIGDPQLLGVGPAGPGQLSANWFRLMPDSPARNAAAPVPIVSVDYFGNPRGLSPTIGAIELVSSLSPASDLRVIAGP